MMDLGRRHNFKFSPTGNVSKIEIFKKKKIGKYLIFIPL